MKQRDTYLNRLLEVKDTSLIKVITGVRRCGKSSLLDLLEAHLLAAGVPGNRIIRMNFELLEFDSIREYKALHQAVIDRLPPEGKVYVLLDEVSFVSEWERAVNSLRLHAQLDIYITGSNAYLLASELSTLLAGRYIEIPMLPLSFKEFLDFNDLHQSGDVQGYFNLYLERGGLPGVTELRAQESAIRQYINGIYHTIILKDVIARNEVRDPALLESVVRYLAGNVGNLVTSKKISDFLTSSGRKTASGTIDNYLRMLENAYVFYRAGRFDVKGKQQLKTQGKYYIVDTGIRGGLVGQRGQDYGFVLENLVYFELLRRGFDVKIGSIGGLEVDFIAQKPEKTLYVQVTATMLSEETQVRELRPLRAIPDYHEKLVLSMDRTPLNDFDGIRNVNLVDFLLA
ncbi:MAG: ATP-binding protein [Oscillospiraceae bacterium]|jgi:predicted AAA+ superfamily ATPase|nr:ATP-binding protein [Oscillospiraceae bacterium]